MHLIPQDGYDHRDKCVHPECVDGVESFLAWPGVSHGRLLSVNRKPVALIQVVGDLVVVVLPVIVEEAGALGVNAPLFEAGP